jgi:hypothetical protein
LVVQVLRAGVDELPGRAPMLCAVEPEPEPDPPPIAGLFAAALFWPPD